MNRQQYRTYSTNKIGLLRVRKNLTQRELAQRVGVSTTALSAIENGYSSPSVRTLLRLCEALGVTCDTPSQGAEGLGLDSSYDGKE